MGISRCAVCETTMCTTASCVPRLSPAQPSLLLLYCTARELRAADHPVTPPILQIAESPVKPVQRSSLSPIRVRWARSY